MRILAASKPLPLEKMGFTERNLRRVQGAPAASPTASCLCVGPTGSGKTTTLHSALGFINTVDMKIWTAEDPVEITQHGPAPGAGAARRSASPSRRAMRAFLRADPDVIMVGEMRDHETAADRHRGLAHRPPGVLDAAHQQRAGDHHPPARHGDRPVQLRRRAARRARAAPGAHAVQGVQASRTRPPHEEFAGDRARALRRRALRPHGHQRTRRTSPVPRPRAAPSAAAPATTAAWASTSCWSTPTRSRR